MNLLRIDYKDKDIRTELSRVIAKNLPIDRDVIIVNIGTDRIVGDALGPLVGTMLNSLGVRTKVYGTLECPIHALNIRERIEEIKQLHPNDFVVATDACLGAKSHIGTIQVRDTPILPGKGVGKTLPRVGDLSVTAIVDKIDEDNRFSFNNIRLNFIMELAEVISFSIYDAIS